MIERAARKHARKRRNPRPELVRSIVIPKRGQPRINGQPVPWFIIEDGLQITMPSRRDFGYVTLELPFLENEISIFRTENGGA